MKAKDYLAGIGMLFTRRRCGLYAGGIVLGLMVICLPGIVLY